MIGEGKIRSERNFDNNVSFKELLSILIIGIRGKVGTRRFGLKKGSAEKRRPCFFYYE